MPKERIEIIPRIHGEITHDGKVSEPDIVWILEKWLNRHPEIEKRRQDIRIERGQWHTREGLKTEVITASIIADKDIAGYDPVEDVDLYEYYLADEWQGMG